MKKLREYVGLDWKKGLMGIATAVMVLLLCFSDAPKKSILLAVICVAVGFLKLKIQSARIKYILGTGLTLLCMIRTFELTPFLLGEIGFGMSISLFGQWTWDDYLLNMMCIAIVILTVFLICGKWRLSAVLGCFGMGVLSLISALVYQFRGREMMYLDLFSVGTALNVVDQYSPNMTSVMWFYIGVWLALILLLLAIPGGEKHGKRTRLAALAVECLLILAVVLGSVNRPCWTWGVKGSRINGYYLNFYLGFRDSFVSDPEGYSPELVANMETDYPDDTGVEKQELPDILVIMNESFADFRYLDSDLRTNIPVMPFVDSLEENTVRGKAVSSIFGGNTANSEFEFLTGNSMTFLPEGSLAYQFYIDEELFSLPWLLRGYGYDTFATHPYLASGWDRTKVYPLLGFEGYSFEEDYPNEKILRKYISDQEMYEYILQKLDAQGDDPLFLFGITMQNHGGYEFEGEFEKTVWLEDDKEYPMVEEYLSLINYSDKALEYLLTELEKRPRDTVVLFFGDHLPKVENAFYDEITREMEAGLQTHMLRYTVPFVIWANFDIPEQTVECTSLNYLGRYLLEAAGLELPPFYQFLKELEQTVPAVSANGYYSSDAGTWLERDKAQGEEAAWLERYNYLQYNSMFDKDGRSGHFFGKYLEAE